MVPKQQERVLWLLVGFRAVLFRMVPKPDDAVKHGNASFRAVLFRMVPKHLITSILIL